MVKKEEAQEPKLETVQTEKEKLVAERSKELGTPDLFVGRTAQDKVLEGFSDVHAADRVRRAEDAGVTDVAHIDYEEALENYEARPDVETLADRRARENGTSFADAAFRRQVPKAGQLGVVVTTNTQNPVKVEDVVNDTK